MNQYYFKQNEVITDEDNNIYNPNYSTKDSDFYFENILKDFVSSKFGFNFTKILEKVFSSETCNPAVKESPMNKTLSLLV